MDLDPGFECLGHSMVSYTTPTAKSKSFIATEPVIEVRAQVSAFRVVFVWEGVMGGVFIWVVCMGFYGFEGLCGFLCVYGLFKIYLDFTFI